MNIGSIKNWLWNHDLPNSICVVFTAILWPLVLWIWNRRKVSHISGLEISLIPGVMMLGTESYPAANLEIKNKTGKVVYLTQARIKNCTKLFEVNSIATRDISTNSFELKFCNGGNCTLHQITLQTENVARTILPLANQLNASVSKYKRQIWRKLILKQKYFVLEFVALVGDQRRFIKLRF